MSAFRMIGPKSCRSAFASSSRRSAAVRTSPEPDRLLLSPETCSSAIAPIADAHFLGQHHLVKHLSSALLVLILSNGCATPGSASLAAPPTSMAVRGEFAERIDRFIANEMEKRHIAGLSVSVISGGHIRYAKGYGLADVERRIPVSAGTPFLIASVTKMFTAVGTMLLVQDGKVQLDTPVGTYVPDLPPHWRPATVRQLLSHTSGINSFTNHDAPPCGPGTREQANYRQQDVIAEVSCLPLDFAPGTNWSYSDTGYFVLGLLIERVSGLNYEKYLRQRIFKPLDMRFTRLMGPMGVNDGRAVGYRWDGTQLVRGPLLSPVVEGPSGGLVATVRDLAKFDAALGNERLLPQRVLEEMWKPSRVGTAIYGLGFARRPINGRQQVGHTGGGPGAATSFARFMDDDLTVIVLTNTAQRPQSIQEIVGGVAERVLHLPAKR